MSYSKLPSTETSIFTIMSKMAQDHGAINLSQGFPDFAVDAKLINLVHHYMLEGYNQYAPMAGILPLREVIAEMISKNYAFKPNPDTEITITAGGTQALFSCISAFIKPGDGVIIFDPAYDSYAPAIKLNGGVPVHINLTYPHFAIDWNLVSRKIDANTKMIIINTPHNPSGSILSEDDLVQLEALVLKHNLIVLSDEVYEKIIFDGEKHNSILNRATIADKCIAAFSFGKTFHATGWKSGFVVAPSSLTSEIRKSHQFMVFSVNTPLQYALADYMKDENNYTSLGKFYQAKRDFFLTQIEGSSFEPLPCHGSYFQLLSYKNISQKPDKEMAELLTKGHKVASIPVSVFYNDKTDNHVLRFCFAKKEETLEKAGAILRKL